MVFIVLIFWMDLEIRFLAQNPAALWIGTCLQRQQAAAMKSQYPCYIETPTEGFWVNWFIIHHFIPQKKGWDLVTRILKAVFCRNLEFLVYKTNQQHFTHVVHQDSHHPKIETVEAWNSFWRCYIVHQNQ